MSKKPSQVLEKSVVKGTGRESAASNSSMERFKVIVAFGVMLLGVVGYYHFALSNGLFAFGALGAGTAVFLVLFFVSQMGRDLVVFFKEARMELRKVVWPTMDETKKMTMIVLFVMALVLLYLMLADSILSNLLKYLLSL